MFAVPIRTLHELEPIASVTQCDLPRTPTPRPRCSQLTALVRTTTSFEAPCSRNSAKGKIFKVCCLSSEQCICNRPITSGLMARECGTTSSSTKEESKGTPSCPCSSALRFTTLYWKFKNRCCRESISLLSSTTFTSFVSLIGPAKCATFWPRNSSHEQGSSCTRARQGRGTKWGFVLRGWRTLARMFGIQRHQDSWHASWE